MLRLIVISFLRFESKVLLEGYLRVYRRLEGLCTEFFFTPVKDSAQLEGRFERVCFMGYENNGRFYHFLGNTRFSPLPSH